MAKPRTFKRYVPKILVRKPPEELFHYTSQQGLLGIFQSKKLWATNAQYLNDSQEMKYAISLARFALNGWEKDREDRKSFRRDVNSLIRTLNARSVINAYVTSFSRVRDQLSQWRGYCQPGPGFCVGFDSQKLANACSEQGFVLVPCLYDEKDQFALLGELFEHSRTTDDFPPGNRFAMLLLRWGVAIKHSGFKEEQEWRLIITGPGTNEFVRPGKSFLVPYLEFNLPDSRQLQLKTITIGPTPHSALSERSLQSAINHHGIKCEKILRSSIPFRDW
jgi:hypothetical protein